MALKLNAALALASMGFKVFPLKEGAKHPPLVKNWPQRATGDETQIRTWWRISPSANIAIHCEGFVVLDVDVRSGGLDSLTELWATCNFQPNTRTTLTPTGGRHYFFKLPEGHPGVSNGAGKLGPGIDIKSTKGYVVAPGSEVEAGRYKFEADVPVAEAPDWLVLKLGMVVPKKGTLPVLVHDAPDDCVKRATDWLALRPKGEAAYTAACGLRDFGLSQDQAVAALCAHDGRPESILRPKVEHAYRYAQNEPGSKVATADEFPIVESAPLAPKKERTGPRRLLIVAKLSAGHTGYLVKGLLQRRSHAVMYGAPGEGKTFVALDLAYHVAAGMEWQSHKVHKGAVLYLAYEGVGGMAKRAAALVGHYGEADVPLYIQGADYNLREVSGRQALAEDLKTLPEKPALIVVDTLARAMKGGDENSAQDMGLINDAVSALIEATGACVLMVHHSGKNKAGGARGSSALLGAIDTELEVDSRQVFSRKQRDIEHAEAINFKLVPVMVGIDEDGEEITSCVVEASTAPAIIASTAASLKGNNKRAFETLCELSLDNAPVKQEDWRRACYEFLPKGENAANKAMYDVRSALKSRGVIEIVDGLVRRKFE